MPAADTPIAKPPRMDRARMERARYPSVIVLAPRFDDIDVLGHVNNVSIVAYLQEARIAFTKAMQLGASGRPHRAFVAAMLVEYGGELNYPGEVELRSGLIEIGRSSYTFAQLVLQDGKPCVYSLVTMVNIGDHGPEAFSTDVRAILEARGLVGE